MASLHHAAGCTWVAATMETIPVILESHRQHRDVCNVRLEDDGTDAAEPSLTFSTTRELDAKDSKAGVPGVAVRDELLDDTGRELTSLFCR